MLHQDGAHRGTHTADSRPGKIWPWRHNLLWDIPIGLFLALGIWFLCLKTAPVIPSTFFTMPLLGLLNFVPVVLVLLGAACLFGNVFAGGTLTLALFGVLNFANRLKIDARDDPLVPQDLTMVREALEAASGYDLQVDGGLLALCVLAGIAMLLCAALLRTEKLRLPRGICWGMRAAGCVVSVVTLVLLTHTVYASADIYASFPITNRFNMTTVYNEAGFNYSFLHNATQYSVQKPTGFSKTETERRISETPVGENDPNHVNVLFVMSEAFCDITNNEHFTWSPGNDPLQNFNKLKGSDRAVSGHLVVYNYGGGTANTEFDVLTGMQTGMLSDAGLSAFRVLHKNVSSVFREAADEGYQTQFIHPGKAWFYNRQNIYRFLGADEIIFEDAFEEPKYRGGYISDETLTGYVLRNYEQHAAAGQPQLTYVTTIQNHMAYSDNKYGGVDGVLAELETDQPLDETADHMLRVYTEGVRDADKMLGELTAYFETRDEPVLLVFYGDHLPSMGEDYLCYRALGMDMTDDPESEAWLTAYAPPFLMWTNEAGAKALDFSTLASRLGIPEDGKLSASYLGSAVLDAIGCGQDDPFFRFVSGMRRQLPVLQRGTAVDARGDYHSSIPPEYADAVSEYRDRVYYRMKYETVP
ncbi:LTA synthase family protein [Agathobaculum sp.]|uniref:LTA synthase family protein n=1 Tax=Agathobaculum sp. TaxID=2048138 RepID=UPI002A8250CF|nr:LTA synthase family protein [Agathobaculum sp.]MDY3618215.1 LTA synthase family protein [Agathobaculum sp.]